MPIWKPYKASFKLPIKKWVELEQSLKTRKISCEVVRKIITTVYETSIVDSVLTS